MSKNNSSDGFVGRGKELERLNRFLQDSSGGAILIAGDRGSGKTSLIIEAIRRRKMDGRNWRSATLSRQVVIHIPLIVGAGVSAVDKPAYYRALLMRTIVRALENEMLTRKVFWLDLPVRWFRPIGYLQGLRQLSPYAKFLSLNHSVAKSLSLSLPANAGGSTGGFNRAVNGEVDIGDAALEIKLREIMLSFSRSLSFIIVLDELDKLPFEPEPIALERIAILLKNLFSETNIHVIFVADEPPLGRILATISRDPFCPERTLFKDMILLNQFSPADYEQFFYKEFGARRNSRTDEARYALAAHTSMMPAELKRFILQNGKRGLQKRLRYLMGYTAYSSQSAMQVYIDEVYTRFSGDYDAYFDRTLYKAMVIAGNVLQGNDSKYVAWSDFRTLFWATELFDDENDEASSKEHSSDIADLKKGISNDKIPEIILQLSILPFDQTERVNTALGYLVALLNRAGWLQLEVVTSRPGIIKLVAFNDLTFNFANIEHPVADAMKKTSRELEIENKFKLRKLPYETVTGKSLYPDASPSPMQEAGEPEYVPSVYLTCFWDVVEIKTDSAPKTIAGVIMDDLRKALPQDTELDLKDNGVIVVRVADSLFQVVVNMGQSISMDLSDKKKTFLLNAKNASRIQSEVRQQVKNYPMGASWSNLQTVAGEIVQKINELSQV